MVCVHIQHLSCSLQAESLQIQRSTVSVATVSVVCGLLCTNTSAHPQSCVLEDQQKDLTDSGMRVADGVADGPAILLK